MISPDSLSCSTPENPWGKPFTPSQAISSTSNVSNYQTASGTPGQGMPSAETVHKQHEAERTIGCTQIAVGLVRYPTGVLSGTVLSVLIITQPIYYILLSMNCCCKEDLAMAMTKIHLKAIGFCFRGFKTEEQCKEEGCC